MTSTGRRTAIGLCAIAVVASAGCAASPRYPIEAGQPIGDGGVHMTEHPQYPIDAGRQPAAGYAPRPSAPPPPPEDEDLPRAPASSGAVDSSDLPPPPPPPPGEARLDAPAADDAPVRGFQSAAYVAPSSSPVLFSDGEASPLFERAAYRHRRHHPAGTPDAASTTDAKADASTAEPKHSARWLRRHPREAARIAAAEKVEARTDATAAVQANTPQHSRAWLRRHPREAARIAAAEKAAKSDAASTEAVAPIETASSAPQHSRLWLRRHPREAARIAAAEKAAAATTSTQAAAPTETASATPQHSRLWLRRHPREAARIAAAEKAAAETAAAPSEPAAPAETASATPQHSRAWLRRHPREAAKLARAAETASGPVAAEGRPHGFSYVIQKGDTLYAVSHRFNLDPTEVAKLNRLHGIGLQPGQTFELPQMAKDLGTRQHAVGVARPVPAPVHLAETTRRRRREADAAAPETPPTESRPTETASTAGRSPATSETSGPDSGSTLPGPPSSVQTAQTGVGDAAAASARATHEATTRADRAATRRAEREARLANERLSRQARRTQAAESAAVSAPYVVHPYTALAAGSGATGISSLPSAVSTPAGTTETNPTDDASAARPAPSTYASAQPPASSPPPVSSPPGSSPAVGPPAASLPTASSPAASSPAASSPVYRAPAPSYAYSPPPRLTPSYVAPTPRPASSYAPPPSTAHGGYSPGQVATLNAPAPSYGVPTLGRVRPTAPALTGGVVSNAAVASAGRGRFVWPLRGAILQPFGDHGPGQRNDGMDISAQPGESVHAAAGGEVVYAGSSIPGFGNLVLVKHPGGWVTAYAHLDRIEVRMRDSVAQGEEIGQAGQTGAVTQPQLHFEVRYAPDANEKARPVDPALVLPGSG